MSSGRPESRPWARREGLTMRTLRGRAVALFIAVATVRCRGFGQRAGRAHGVVGPARRADRARGREAPRSRVRAPGSGRLPLRSRVQEEHRGRPRHVVGRRQRGARARAVPAPRRSGSSRDDVDLIDAALVVADLGRARQVRPEDEADHRAGQEARWRHEGHAGARAHARAAGSALRPAQAPKGS